MLNLDQSKSNMLSYCPCGNDCQCQKKNMCLLNPLDCLLDPLPLSQSKCPLYSQHAMAKQQFKFSESEGVRSVMEVLRKTQHNMSQNHEDDCLDSLSQDLQSIYFGEPHHAYKVQLVTQARSNIIFFDPQHFLR